MESNLVTKKENVKSANLRDIAQNYIREISETVDEYMDDPSEICAKVLDSYQGSLPGSKLEECSGNKAVGKACLHSCYGLAVKYSKKKDKDMITREQALLLEMEGYKAEGIDLKLPITRADFARFYMRVRKEHDMMRLAVASNDPKLPEDGMEELAIAKRIIGEIPPDTNDIDCPLAGDDIMQLKKCEASEELRAEQCPATCRTLCQSTIKFWADSGNQYEATPQEILDEARGKFAVLTLLEKEYRIEEHPFGGTAKLKARIKKWDTQCELAKKDVLAEADEEIPVYDHPPDWDLDFSVHEGSMRASERASERSHEENGPGFSHLPRMSVKAIRFQGDGLGKFRS